MPSKSKNKNKNKPLAHRFRNQFLRSRIALFSIALPLLALNLLNFGGSVLRIVYVMLGFSLIIFFHELGHFMVARICSVKCLAFSLGIGPRMLGYRKGAGLTFGSDPFDPEAKTKTDEKTLGEKEDDKYARKPLENATDKVTAPLGVCDYRISWLPLGGYVRMLGQDDMDPTKVSTDPNAFNQRPIWQRMCIVSAGVIMNVIFAAVAFTVIFSTTGVKFPTADIGFVQYGMPADGKLQLGDRIVAINGRQARPGGFIEYTDLVIASALSSGNEEIKLDFIRPGVEGVQQVAIKPVRAKGEPFLAIGVSGPMPSLNIASQENINAHQEMFAKPESKGGLGDPQDAKEIAQLHPGDRIVAINGEPVHNYLELYNKVQAIGGKPVEISLLNPKGKGEGADHTITITPRLVGQLGAEFPSIFGLSPRTWISFVEGPGRILFVIPTAASPAARAGIKVGDEIVSINNRRWPTVEQFRNAITSSGDREIDITVLRDGEEIPLKVTPANGLIGVGPSLALNNLAVVPREGGSGPAADVLGPNAEMKIASVDDQPVKNWWDVLALLKAKKAGDQVTFAFVPAAPSLVATSEPATEPATQVAALTSEPATEPATQVVAVTKTFTVDEALVQTLARRTHYLLNLPVDMTQRVQRADTIPDAAMMGLEHTEKFIGQVYMTLVGLARRTVSPDNLHGIVGIGYIGYQVQERGMAWFWYLMAMISVNLAVANFLPLPIVDGGLFLLLILEKIRGKPLSLKVQSAIQLVGIVLLASLFLYVTHNDIQLFFK
ncbi:MAG: site-2 protease family protein [Phycisphaerales bacterium]|nr:site-2 protease family protein [Phycisphaerales bacterium]